MDSGYVSIHIILSYVLLLPQNLSSYPCNFTNNKLELKAEVSLT